MGRTTFFLVFGMLIRHLTSVVVRHFDIVGVTINEAETDTPLVISRDRVLSLSISPEFVKPIARRNP